MSARGVSLWRAPRSRSLLLLGTLGLLGGAVSLVAHAYTDLLWFRELGQEGVFWTTLKWKVLAQGVLGFGTAGFLMVNFAAVERVMAPHAPLRPYRRLAYPAAAIVGGLISGQWHAEGAWRLLALWAGRSDFSAEDPLFHRDVSFFVFSLPLYEQAARWLLETVAMAAVATAAAYLAAGGLRRSRPYVAVRAARAHLLMLAAVALVVMAWRYRLDEFELALPHTGSTVPGAAYTDVHVSLPTLRVFVLLCLAGAALCLYAARRRVLRIPVTAVAALAVVAIVGKSALPAAIEHLDVEPQELSRETPYLADAIASTRRAFALDHVGVRALPSGGTLSARAITESRRTLDNVPLWDAGVLKPEMNELQSIGRYYRFPSVTVDQYTIGGIPRLVSVAARQLDRSRSESNRSWANDRFAYTHGYGVVVARAGRADAVGHPRFLQRGFRSAGTALRLREPRIYFGEQPGSDPPYLVLDSRRGEVDEPVAGSQTPRYHYDGTGGIPLASVLRRAAFAVRFGDHKLLLSETVTERSRIVLHRDVRERVRILAPFLRWSRHPQTAVIDGRVQFLLHGYTTSSNYPYSATVRIGRTDVNYMRAAAEAVVDSFSGRVSIYATGSGDPIMRAWQATYPSLFLPASQMPREVRAHLRYPRALFMAQAKAYATYHAVDATSFWNGTDEWERPLQLAGPIEAAGEIHFPNRQKRVRSDRRQMRPDYLFARLPGRASERLMLATPFSPRGRGNLSAYLAGWIDSHGSPRLTLLSLPRDRLTLGPSQATRQILASPAVSRRLDLLNRESRDLAKAAVSRTILGAGRLVPVGDSLVHVQPVYLVAGGSGVPTLQFVTVYVDGRVGYGRDLESALRRAVTRQSGGRGSSAPASDVR